MKLRNIMLLLFCLVLVGLTLRVYGHTGVPYTHDGENHLARFASYRAAVREGQLPPRFAPYLENGYGYPVFNYNYPLANILSVPLSFAGFSYETTFKLLVVGFLTIGAGALWLWLAQYVKTVSGRCVALLTWVSAPFLIQTVLFRGSIGELLVYGLVPALLYSTQRLLSGARVELWQYAVWIAFFLAHNVSVVWVTPIMLAYFLVEWIQRDKSTESAWNAVKLVSISGAATLWFWLPALTEMPAVVLGGAQNALAFADHFPTAQQLLSAPLQFGYSYPGSVDTLSFAVGLIVWLTLLMFPIWFVAKSYTKNEISFPTSMFFWCVAITLVLLQLKGSTVIWQLVPFLRFIQFPWRLALLLPVISAPLIGMLVDALQPFWQRIVLIVATLYWVQITGTAPLELLHHPDIRYDSFALNTTTQNENRAKSFTYLDIGNNPRTPFFLNGSGEVTNLVWQGSKRTYTLDVKTEGIVVEPTMNFPGWQTTLNDTEIEYSDSDEIGGRIAYTVTPGLYTVFSQFTQRTLPRRIGNAVSLVAFIWLAVSSLQFNMYKKRSSA